MNNGFKTGCTIDYDAFRVLYSFDINTTLYQIEWGKTEWLGSTVLRPNKAIRRGHLMWQPL